jgi:serine/threonine protein kinase
MVGELLRSQSLGPAVDALEARLGSRFRISGMLPWGHTVPFYRAELDGEPVALATLPVDCHVDPESEAEFLCAAFELESLSGPGLPEVVDQGVVDGLPYLAYRMTEGRVLASLLARGRLSSRLLLRVGEALLDALAACHRLGMVHGELCPENVLVDDTGDHPVVTLLGSGLIPFVLEARARVKGRDSGPAPAASAYKAPELFGGAAPTPQADLYALGALLHHMVAGRPPEGFDSAEAYADVPALVDVVRRAMSREPARRYENASTMRSALDWVEIESEKMNAHTLDIPLWMEHSIVGNIPVPDLLRAKSSPPRAGLPSESVELPAPAPLPGGVRFDGTNPRFRIDRTDPSIRVEFDDLEPTPIARPRQSNAGGVPLWVQATLAAALVAGVGLLTWVLTG